jgi:hypothetical protein
LLSSQDPAVRQNAAALIYSLSTEASQRAELASVGAIPRLQGALRNADPASEAQQLRQLLVLTLCNATEDPRCREQLVNTGGLKVLVDVLRSEGARQVALRERVLWALANVASEGSQELALETAGAFEAIVQSMKQSMGNATASACLSLALKTLLQLLRSDSSRPGLRAAGAVEVLRELAGSVPNSVLSQAAYKALAFLE